MVSFLVLRTRTSLSQLAGHVSRSGMIPAIRREYGGKTYLQFEMPRICDPGPFLRDSKGQTPS